MSGTAKEKYVVYDRRLLLKQARGLTADSLRCWFNSCIQLLMALPAVMEKTTAFYKGLMASGISAVDIKRDHPLLCNFLDLYGLNLNIDNATKKETEYNADLLSKGALAVFDNVYKAAGGTELLDSTYDMIGAFYLYIDQLLVPDLHKLFYNCEFKRYHCGVCRQVKTRATMEKSLSISGSNLLSDVEFTQRLISFPLVTANQRCDLPTKDNAGNPIYCQNIIPKEEVISRYKRRSEILFVVLNGQYPTVDTVAYPLKLKFTDQNGDYMDYDLVAIIMRPTGHYYIHVLRGPLWDTINDTRINVNSFLASDRPIDKDVYAVVYHMV